MFGSDGGVNDGAIVQPCADDENVHDEVANEQVEDDADADDGGV